MKTVMRLVTLLSLAMLGSTAYADPITLDYGDGHYLGAILPDQPANEADEASYINVLITVLMGNYTDCGQVNRNTVRYCDRLDSTLETTFPTATADGAVKDDTDPSATGIDVTGFDYVLGKYGQDALVWFIGDQDYTELNIISSWTPPAGCEDGARGGDCPDGGGLSHWTLFNFNGGPGPHPIPEPGTLGLLGLGLLGLGLRRRSKI